VDPDPDPRIHASDEWIRILLFSSLLFKMPTKNRFKKKFSCTLLLEVTFTSKVKSQKEVTIQKKSKFFLLFLLNDRRIRIQEPQKHVVPVDPDPQHCLKGLLTICRSERENNPPMTFFLSHRSQSHHHPANICCCPDRHDPCAGRWDAGRLAAPAGRGSVPARAPGRQSRPAGRTAGQPRRGRLAL
jgi:hypothetical protein